jgi:hypothetical protein
MAPLIRSRAGDSSGFILFMIGCERPGCPRAPAGAATPAQIKLAPVGSPVALLYKPHGATAPRGKTGWREVEIGRGFGELTC